VEGENKTEYLRKNVCEKNKNGTEQRMPTLPLFGPSNLTLFYGLIALMVIHLTALNEEEQKTTIK